MNVEIYTLCHNEVKILPYFMRHYSQYGKVFVFEGGSTDGSRDLAASLGATVLDSRTSEVRDDIFTDIKNNCWKQSKADWVIICDMDEFLFHPRFIAYLKQVKQSIIFPRTYEMMSDVYPTTPGQIYDEVKWGFPTRSKMFMFKPSQVRVMSYGVGCHDGMPEGSISYEKEESEIFCMHMRHLSIEHIVQRNAYIYSRMSEINKKNGWGWHTGIPRAQVESYFNSHRDQLIKLI